MHLFRSRSCGNLDAARSIRSGASGLLRTTAAIPFAVVASVSAAWASPAMPGWREYDWDQQFQQPFHLQARVVSAPIMGWQESLGEGPCEADAVALRTFKGADRIRVGQRFSFRWHCDGQWFTEGHQTPQFFAADPVGGAQRGELLELFLTDDRWVSPWGMKEGLHRIDRPTPMLVLDKPPPGLDAQYLAEVEGRPEPPSLVPKGPRSRCSRSGTRR